MNKAIKVWTFYIIYWLLAILALAFMRAVANYEWPEIQHSINFWAFMAVMCLFMIIKHFTVKKRD